MSCREASEIIGLSEHQVAYFRRQLGIGRGNGWNKGHAAVNRMEFGTRKLDGHGRYVLVKIKDTNDWHKDWAIECTYVWKQHYGEYDTKANELVHLDGDIWNNSIENLYLVSKAIAMRLTQNHWRFKGQPELQILAIKIAELITELSKQGLDYKQYYRNSRRIYYAEM